MLCNLFLLMDPRWGSNLFISSDRVVLWQKDQFLGSCMRAICRGGRLSLAWSSGTTLPKITSVCHVCEWAESQEGWPHHCCNLKPSSLVCSLDSIQSQSLIVFNGHSEFSRPLWRYTCFHASAALGYCFPALA